MTADKARLRIENDLIVTGLEASDRWEVIDRLGGLLLAKGYVTEEYCAKTKEREQGFPTALPTEPYPVAIPHTSAEYCREPSLAVGILAKPVPWIEMGTKDRVRQVQIVLLLSITQPEAQVGFLRKVVDFLVKPGNQEKLMSGDGADTIRAVLEEGLAGD